MKLTNVQTKRRYTEIVHIVEWKQNINHDDEIGKSDIESFSSSEEEDEIKIKDKIDEEELKEKDSKIRHDSILLPFGRPSEVGSSLADALSCQIEKRGVFSKKRMNTRQQRKRKKYMKKLNLAPAEGNLPQNWLSDPHLEEKSFPHLFPSGTI